MSVPYKSHSLATYPILEEKERTTSTTGSSSSSVLATGSASSSMSSAAIPPSPQARCPPFYKDDKGYVWVQELVDGPVSCVGTAVERL